MEEEKENLILFLFSITDTMHKMFYIEFAWILNFLNKKNKIISSKQRLNVI